MVPPLVPPPNKQFKSRITGHWMVLLVTWAAGWLGGHSDHMVWLSHAYEGTTHGTHSHVP